MVFQTNFPIQLASHLGRNATALSQLHQIGVPTCALTTAATFSLGSDCISLCPYVPLPIFRFRRKSKIITGGIKMMHLASPREDGERSDTYQSRKCHLVCHCNAYGYGTVSTRNGNHVFVHLEILGRRLPQSISHC